MKIYTEKLRYSVKELEIALGVSRQTILNRIKTGQMKAVRDGRSRYVSREALAEYMSKDQSGATPRAKPGWYKALRRKAKATKGKGASNATTTGKDERRAT